MRLADIIFAAVWCMSAEGNGNMVSSGLKGLLTTSSSLVMLGFDIPLVVTGVCEGGGLLESVMGVGPLSEVAERLVGE